MMPINHQSRHVGNINLNHETLGRSGLRSGLWEEHGSAFARLVSALAACSCARTHWQHIIGSLSETWIYIYIYLNLRLSPLMLGYHRAFAWYGGLWVVGRRAGPGRAGPRAKAGQRGGPGPPGAQTSGTRSGGPGVLALVHIIHIYINIHKHIIHTYESTQKHCYTPRHAPQPTCDLYVVASSGVKRLSTRLRLTVVQVAAVLDISYMACV